jgi:hypothetical protein
MRNMLIWKIRTLMPVSISQIRLSSVGREESSSSLNLS